MDCPAAAGFDRGVFAEMLRFVHRRTDQEFADYGLDRDTTHAPRLRFADWQFELEP
jgi:hypothetical protein